jgi:hypothetical protein
MDKTGLNLKTSIAGQAGSGAQRLVHIKLPEIDVLL